MISRRQMLAQGAGAVLVVAVPLRLRAEAPAVYAPQGLALGGVDPVAYFSMGGPVLGERAHELMWRGTMWRFVSAANRDVFEMDPVGHAPRFGCYCAYAMAQGRFLGSDPAAFVLHHGRLYLFSEVRVRDLWLADVAANLERAAQHWSVLAG